MFCRLIVRNVNLSKFYTIPQHRRYNSKIRFFTEILEFSSRSATQTFLRKNDCVLKMDQTDVFQSFKYLTNIGITIDDIRKQPNILCSKEPVLRNRHEILLECGCPTVSVFLLNKYNTISSQPEMALKRMGIIDNDINLQQRLADYLNLNVKLDPCNEDVSLTDVRMHFLRLFYSQNSYMTANEFDDVIKGHPYAKYKSYRWIKDIMKILIEQLHIPKEKIKHKFHVLQADPDNLQKLLSIKPIGGVTMVQILQRTPCLKLASYEDVQSTLTELKKFGISEESITKCSQVLAMDLKIVRSRLAELKSRKKLQIMDFHPSVLKLIMQNFKAHSRLDYLNELEKKCFSISSLTGAPVQFHRFTNLENDKNKSKDCLLFLSKILKLEVEQFKTEISRHPYWLYIPFTNMEQTINMLRRAEFELKDICENIHIVLYSGDLILNRLKKFSETERIDLTKSTQLKMILYHIEVEFNFSGDGVFQKLNSD